MKHQLRIRPLVAAVVLLQAAVAAAVEQSIPVPGEGWRLTFDAPLLAQRPFPPSFRGGVFSGIADRFQVTFFVDQPWCSGPDTHENLYACFVTNTATNPYVLPDSVRGNTTRYGVQTMTFMRVPTRSGAATNMGMHLLFARNGKWADFHASFASPNQADAKALFAIMESIRVEDDPGPAPVAPVDGVRDPAR
jgi:hypothetical protein